MTGDFEDRVGTLGEVILIIIGARLSFYACYQHNGWCGIGGIFLMLCASLAQDGRLEAEDGEDADPPI